LFRNTTMPDFCYECKVEVEVYDKTNDPNKCSGGKYSGVYFCCVCWQKRGHKWNACSSCVLRVGKSQTIPPKPKRVSAPPAAAAAPAAQAVAAPSAARIRNPPGKWKSFLSHVQGEAGKEAQILFYELGGAPACWLDVKMGDKAVEAMMEGVQGSANFLLILTPGYFDRPFCIKELEMAVQCKKNIVLCHTSSTKSKLSELFQQAHSMGFNGIGNEESVELILNDPDYLAVTIMKLQRKFV